MPAKASLDHLVLPAVSLDAARTRLLALGFTVAPVGVHPFGTANACVYFADGTFLEPLAVADQGAATEAIDAQNVFVAKDRAFRAMSGEEGFSALVLGSADGELDHQRFLSEGISAGPPLQFSRMAIDANGKADEAVFRLVFAEDVASPEPFFFSCQRVRPPSVDRASLQAHRNGVTRLKGVLMVAQEPEAHRDFWKKLVPDSEPVPAVGGYDYKLANAAIRLRDPNALLDQFGTRTDAAAGMRFTGIEFGCRDLQALTALFNADAISYEERNHSIIVPPASGQGTYFIFEAEQ